MYLDSTITKKGGGKSPAKMYSILFLSSHFHVHLVIAVQVFTFLHIIKLFEQIKYHLGKMHKLVLMQQYDFLKIVFITSQTISDEVVVQEMLEKENF